MNVCNSPNCVVPVPPGNRTCWKCARNEVLVRNKEEAPSGGFCDSSGGDNDYWIAKVTDPKRLQPYEAECEDLIELFLMTFQEGEAFKALWRNGQMRIGNGKSGDSHLRNAQKVNHFGSRMVTIEQRKTKES